MALSNRSKIFLRKVKAQSGLQVPYMEPDPTLENYSMTAPAGIENNLQPNFDAAKKQATQGIFSTGQGAIQLSNTSMDTGAMDAAQIGSGENTASSISRKIGSQGIPFLSNWVKSVVGGWDFVKSFEDKKRQQAYERNSQADLKQRKNEARANNFYMTPYTLGRTDDYTKKKGGLIKDKYQMGGSPIDAFMAYYNNQQDLTKQSIDQLQQGYEDKNTQLMNAWKERRSEGLAQHIGAGAASFGEYMSTFGGGMGGGSAAAAQQGGYIPTVSVNSQVNSTATPVFPKVDTLKQASQNVNRAEKDMLSFVSNNREGSVQLRKMLAGADPEKIVIGKPNTKFRFREKQEGGDIDQIDQTDQINPTEDLYSDQFQSPWGEQRLTQEQLENKIKVESPDISLQNNSNMLQFLFEEEPIEKYTTSDIYFKIFGQEQEQEQSNNLPIQPIVDQFRQMGLKPSSINTGEHNVGSLHSRGKAVDYGLNTSFGGDINKMNEFYNYLTSAEGRKKYPDIKIRDERTRPAGQKVWNGSHLHIEIQ